MGDIKSRLRNTLFRRSSSTAISPTTTRRTSAGEPSTAAAKPQSPAPTPAKRPKTSASRASVKEKPVGAALDKSARGDKNSIASVAEGEKNEDRTEPVDRPESLRSGDLQTLESSIISIPSTTLQTPGEAPPELVIQEPTPGSPPVQHPLVVRTGAGAALTEEENPPSRAAIAQRAGFERKQSLVARVDADVIKALLQDDSDPPPVPIRGISHRQALTTTATSTTALNTSMLHRKVWVKRPGAAATIVLIREDDLVDDAKDSILRKYTNSLGRHFDAPDITIRITMRGQSDERILAPDEPMCRTLDSFYPNGQSVDEALLIDVPARRTPRPSPRGMQQMYNNSHFYHQQDDTRPHESGTDYFPPMPPVNNFSQPSPLLTSNSHDSRSHESRQSHAAHERAMSVLSTGQVPALPSPGAASRRSHLSKQHRPTYPRTLTSSPTALNSSVSSRANRPRLDSTASAEKHAIPSLTAPAAPTLPTPPAPTVEQDRTVTTVVTGMPKSSSNPPTPRVASPRPSRNRKTRQKQTNDTPTLPPTILDTSVPPINVLIVEDNMINMRLLEQFVRRLGVRWQTAVNGQEAVKKWRQGGFHLVLMDIQLPIMSGLEATKEIRRLERVNNIGVFSSASNSAPDCAPEDGEVGEVKEADKLRGGDMEMVGRFFKSPVIIVALTASNLQSDRHEALAAGCNDFLTKPVNFVWFERKVKEWGCMQALIDFDGWRKWKDFATANGLKEPSQAAKKKFAAGKKPINNVKSPEAKDFATPKKETPTREKATTPEKPEQQLPVGDKELQKEDSPDTVVNVGTGN